jgi:hypothetical protein
MSPVAIVGIVAGAMALVLLWRGLFGGYPTPTVRGGLLSAKEQALIAAVADAMFPPCGPIPISGTEAGLVLYMEESLRCLPKQSLALVRLLFVFIEHGPWIFGPLRPRFTKLSREARIDALARMGKSSLYIRRVAFLSMRTMLSMGYFANDVVIASIGCTPCLAPFERGPMPPRPRSPDGAASRGVAA